MSINKPRRRAQGQVRRVVPGRDDKWMCIISLGTGPDGKRRNLNHTFNGTEKQAKEWVIEKLAERNRGVNLKGSAQSLDAYLDDWLAAVRDTVRKKTFSGYEEVLARYIRPALGRRPLARVSTLNIQAVCNGMSQRGLSPSTVSMAHTVLRQALTKAVRLRLLTFNPTDNVQLPRKQRQEMLSFTPEQARRFLALIRDTPQWGPLFSLALTAGLRPSELLGLKWSDIDLARSTVTIQRSLEYRSSSDWNFATTKTRRSRRHIKLHGDVAALLGQHHREQEQLRSKSEYWEDHDLVFCTRNGRPLEHTNVAGIFRRILQQHNDELEVHRSRCFAAGDITGGRALERLKFPRLRLYDLRHTAASLALAAGVNPKIVSEMLGHASVTLTLDVYSHVVPGMQEEAVSRVEALLQTDKGVSHSISHTTEALNMDQAVTTH